MVNLYVNSHSNKKEVKLPRGEIRKVDHPRVLPRPPLGLGKALLLPPLLFRPPTSPHCVLNPPWPLPQQRSPHGEARSPPGAPGVLTQLVLMRWQVAFPSN